MKELLLANWHIVALLFTVAIAAVPAAIALLGFTNANDQKLANDIAINAIGFAEEWASSRARGTGISPEGAEKLNRAYELALQFASGRLKRWGEEKWKLLIESKLPAERPKLKVPEPKPPWHEANEPS